MANQMVSGFKYYRKLLGEFGKGQIYQNRIQNSYILMNLKNVLC